MTPRTRLVAIGAASNAIGTINDVARATALAHGVGALAFVDAVHYAPHALVDVRALGCDLLACSAYKFYGPHVGVLYGRHDLLASLDVPKLQPAPDTAPERLETGTQNHEGIVGAGAAVGFLASLAVSAPGESLSRRAALERVFAELHARGQALVTRLYTGLQALPGVTVYGPPPSAPRTPTVAFAVRDRPSDEVARELVSRGLFLSNGDFYAQTIVERLGHGSRRRRPRRLRVLHHRGRSGAVDCGGGGDCGIALRCRVPGAGVPTCRVLSAECWCECSSTSALGTPALEIRTSALRHAGTSTVAAYSARNASVGCTRLLLHAGSNRRGERDQNHDASGAAKRHRVAWRNRDQQRAGKLSERQRQAEPDGDADDRDARGVAEHEPADGAEGVAPMATRTPNSRVRAVAAYTIKP